MDNWQAVIWVVTIVSFFIGAIGVWIRARAYRDERKRADQPTVQVDCKYDVIEDSSVPTFKRALIQVIRVRAVNSGHRSVKLVQAGFRGESGALRSHYKPLETDLPKLLTTGDDAMTAFNFQDMVVSRIVCNRQTVIAGSDPQNEWPAG